MGACARGGEAAGAAVKIRRYLAPVPDRSAAQIPGLQVLGELGRGARCVVYRARRGDFVVALKLPAGGRDDRAALQQFRREAVTLASVAHPCLAQVFEVGEAEGLPYAIREWVEGRSLAARLVLGPLPEPEVAALGRQLAQALAAIHRRRLVHREVGPHNVLVADGVVKLVDFGAPRLGEEHSYHAPEQTGLLDRPVDGRADLYALGCTAYAALTGKPPFLGTVKEIVRQKLQDDPAPFAPALQVPPAVDRLVRKVLLARDPDARPQDAAELLAELDALERPGRGGGGGGARRPIVRARAKGMPTGLVVFVFGLLVIGVLLVIVMKLKNQQG